jgi:hypothetical protein
MMLDPSQEAALREALSRPDMVQTYPPAHPGGVWRARLISAIAVSAIVRPHFHVGIGNTERAAIEHLIVLEAADTWSAEG